MGDENDCDLQFDKTYIFADFLSCEAKTIH